MRSDIVINPFGLHAADAVTAAVAAERAGFSSLWTYDHLSGVVMGAESTLDLWTMLGALATATQTIGVGPLVANVTTRHPAVTAVASATLGQLAPGRVTLGLGAGAGTGSRFAAELEMTGIETYSAAARRRMLADAVEVIRALWDGTSDYEGERFRLTGASGFLRSDPPAIIVGCNGPKMAELAGRIADGANFHGWEDDLPSLIASAAGTAGAREFEYSVEAPPDADWEDWLAPWSARRAQLADMGVTRVMVVWRGEQGLQQIESAADYLGGAAQAPAG